MAHLGNERAEETSRLKAAAAVRERLAKRWIYRGGAVAVFCLGSLTLLTREQPLRLLTLSVLWALHIFVVGELVGRGKLSARVGGLVSSTGGIFYLPAIVYTALPTNQSVIFTVLVCMPLIIAALVPDDRGSFYLNAAGSLSWIIALEVTSFHEPAQAAVAVFVSLCCSGIGFMAMVNHDRSRAAERRAVQERIDALERLAALERDRAQVERLVILGQLSAAVAHELTSPLSSVIVNVDCLREELAGSGPLDPDQQAILESARTGLQRIRQISLDLRAVSREDAGEPEACQLAEAIADAVRLASFRMRYMAKVVNQVPSDCCQVSMTQGRLVQVLLNLLINSADAMESEPDHPQGLGEIRISVERTRPDRVNIFLEDSGPGISSEVMPRLFDPFFTTKARGKGTGLGLALCRQYVEGAHGSIRAENREQGGARFVMELPVVSATPSAETSAQL